MILLEPVGIDSRKVIS